MNIEDIQKFLDNETSNGNECVKISFKKREAIVGLFIKYHNDYGELKSKNFWRIVPQSQLDSFNHSKNVNLAKIFSGTAFSRLTTSKE